METVNGRHINCNDIYHQWLDDILNSGLDIYWLRNNLGINKEANAYNKIGCVLICKHTYGNNDNRLIMDFINEMKPLFIMVIRDVEGDYEYSELTNMIDNNNNYKIIKRMTECRFDYEYVTTVYSTDKSIACQECVEYERGVGVEWL